MVLLVSRSNQSGRDGERSFAGFLDLTRADARRAGTLESGRLIDQDGHVTALSANFDSREQKERNFDNEGNAVSSITKELPFDVVLS